MSQEPLAVHVDGETNEAINDYAAAYDLSPSDALEELVAAGWTHSNPDTHSESAERELTPAQLEARQQTIAQQQRQIVRFQKVTIFGGLGWAVLTLATSATGPVWTAIGMFVIVLMAASTYAWEYVPGFE